MQPGVRVGCSERLLFACLRPSDDQTTARAFTCYLVAGALSHQKSLRAGSASQSRPSCSVAGGGGSSIVAS